MMIVSSWTIHALSLAISRQKSLSLSFFIPRIAGRSPSGNGITALGRIADWRMGEMVIARGALGGWSDSIDKKERERERETGLRLRTRRIEKSRLESHFWAARALLYNHLRPVTIPQQRSLILTTHTLPPCSRYLPLPTHALSRPS